MGPHLSSRWADGALMTGSLCVADPLSPKQRPHPASHQPEWCGAVPLGHPEEPPLLGQKGKEELQWAGSGPGCHLCPECRPHLPAPPPQIAEKVGCPTDDTARMAGCLKVTDPRAVTLAYKMPLAGMECELGQLGGGMGAPCGGGLGFWRRGKRQVSGLVLSPACWHP